MHEYEAAFMGFICFEERKPVPVPPIDLPAPNEWSASLPYP
jgi:hypothetical protein